LKRRSLCWERPYRSELNRHKGQLLLRQGYSVAAEELYRKALDISREQEAKLWELRAVTGLARLRRDQGCHPDARDVLALSISGSPKALTRPT
jgi:Flp pilus assembly protein TadD